MQYYCYPFLVQLIVLPLSPSLSLRALSLSLFLRYFTFFFPFFLRVPVSRFRRYCEELSWNKAQRHQMFILFFSVSLLCLKSKPFAVNASSSCLLCALHRLTHTVSSLECLRFFSPVLIFRCSVCYQLGSLTHI